MPSTNQSNNPSTMPEGEDPRLLDSNDVMSLNTARRYAAEHPESVTPVGSTQHVPTLSDAQITAEWKARPEAQRRGDC